MGNNEFDFREVSDEQTTDFREVTYNNPISTVADPVEAFKGKKGLVLCGGGAKGVFQCGVLRILKEKGLLDNIGAISGVSIGAINSVLYMMDDMDGMDKVWDDMDPENIISIDNLEIGDNGLYFSRSKVTKILTDYLDFDKIRNSDIKLYAGVSKILGPDSYIAEYMTLNGKSDAEIKDIITASSSLPVIYEPVKINGALYMDGGPTDNEPVKPLYDAGIRDFIVIGMTYGKKFDETKYPGAHFEVIYPSLDLGGLLSGTLNFYDSNKEFVRKLGRKDAERYIKIHIEMDESYIAMEQTLKEIDQRSVINDARATNAYNTFHSRISSSMDYIKNLDEKYKDY